MQYKINKEAFDTLSEDLQKLYDEIDGDYILQVEGLPKPDKGGDDNSGLINKNKELLDELKKIKAKAREEEIAKSKAEEEAARKAGDIEALEKSWSEKLNKSVAEKQAVRWWKRGFSSKIKLFGTSPSALASFSCVGLCSLSDCSC